MLQCHVSAKKRSAAAAIGLKTELLELCMVFSAATALL